MENKESFTSRPSAWKNYASALVLCAFKNSKSSRLFRYQINVVALFSAGGRSTRKTLLIFHGTIDKSQNSENNNCERHEVND